MAVSAGSPSVSDVKGKLQGVLAELEKYKDLYRTTSQELETEKDKRTKVLAAGKMRVNCHLKPNQTIVNVQSRDLLTC